MKKYLFILFLILNVGCQSNTDNLEKYARNAFINKCEYMSEREALSSEIDWYRQPQFSESRFAKSLTGKDLVHLCNQIEEKNTYDRNNPISLGPTTYSITYPVGDIKEYALDNIDKTVGYLYHYTATFTTANRNHKYDSKSANVLVIPGMNDIILYSDPGVNGYWYVIGIQNFDQPWYEKI